MTWLPKDHMSSLCAHIYNLSTIHISRQCCSQLQQPYHTQLCLLHTLMHNAHTLHSQRRRSTHKVGEAQPNRKAALESIHTRAGRMTQVIHTRQSWQRKATCTPICAALQGQPSCQLHHSNPYVNLALVSTAIGVSTSTHSVRMRKAVQ